MSNIFPVSINGVSFMASSDRSLPKSVLSASASASLGVAFAFRVDVRLFDGPFSAWIPFSVAESLRLRSGHDLFDVILGRDWASLLVSVGRFSVDYSGEFVLPLSNSDHLMLSA